MKDDTALLQQYASERSEEAFRELVRRHAGLVYSAALRRTQGNIHQAEDIAQQVFTKLARDAAKVSRHPALSAWLYTATRNAALNLLQSEQRRSRREQKSQAMHDLIAEYEPEAGWERLRPMLDSVLDQLSEADRTVVMLRFFEKRPFGEIGARLNLTENAARMRTERALDRLRRWLARQGVTSSSAALAGALGAQTAAAAPAGFTSTLASTALASAAARGASPAWLRLFLAMNKIKMGIAGGIVLAGLLTASWEIRANRVLGAEATNLQAAVQGTAALARESTGRNSEAVELVRLTSRITQLKARPDGITDSAMKPRASWQNLGRTTPAAAFETLMWGFSVKNEDAITAAVAFNASDQAILDRWFAGLPEAVREQYGSPRRLLAPLFEDWSNFDHDPVAAFQVLDQSPHGPNGMEVTYWERLASGQERQSKIDFTEEKAGAGNWQSHPSGHGMSPDQWQKMVFSQIDPATGQVIAHAQ